MIENKARFVLGWPHFAFLLMAFCGAYGFFRLLGAPNPQVELAGYATSLQGRTSGQKHNARLAAEAINGKSVAPGAVFSFNRAVKSWSVDQGYVKAPVSFDGDLVRSYGGGVCQTSTTLYNAALLAGLPIVERHPHEFRPLYVAPGRDAAVAFPGVDLRFKNPYSWPLHIRASAHDNRLEVRLLGAQAPPGVVRVETDVIARAAPRRVTRLARRGSGRNFLRSPGVSGFRVVSYRVFLENGRAVRREQLSDDSYPAMNDVTALARN